MCAAAVRTRWQKPKSTTIWRRGPQEKDENKKLKEPEADFDPAPKLIKEVSAQGETVVPNFWR